MKNKIPEKQKTFIIGGSPDCKLPASQIATCEKCGNKTTVSGKNLQRIKNKNTSVLCPDCGAKLLAKGVGTGKLDKIVFPPAEEMEKLIGYIMNNNELKSEFMKNLVQKTAYCKKCGMEFGHLMSNGAFLLNKSNIDLKNFSPNNTELQISLRRKQDGEEDDETKFGGVS